MDWSLIIAIISLVIAMASLLVATIFNNKSNCRAVRAEERALYNFIESKIKDAIAIVNLREGEKRVCQNLKTALINAIAELKELGIDMEKNLSCIAMSANKALGIEQKKQARGLTEKMIETLTNTIAENI